ncbi:hypothetical protein GKZ89_11760 [Bacillus mangrovi]|uniref:Uncharacterized protein n=1 Tax=Metabacillus mangrovi TaxID=1491830 RepID=A0A7X2S6C8_9BACI|nr:hypothetical protein [Metabacillus mangrovi]MTH54085.1 hypothetical protein [Metabacillus mangrovi]
MKRMLFFIAITSIVFLGGCGFNTDQMDEMLNALAEDKSVKEFVKTVGYKQLEGPVEDSTYGDEGDVSYSYEINGTLVDTFDKVSAKEQFAFMESVIKKQKNSQVPLSIQKEKYTAGAMKSIAALTI